MQPAILILPIVVLFALPIAAQQPDPIGSCKPNDSCKTDDVEPYACPSFNGTLSFRSTKGLVQGSVVMQQWQIANDGRVEIPHRGLLIVHLRGGSLVTEIGEQRKEWSEDSFWMVTASERLIVYTARDSVVLQTVDFIIH